jgi:TRAP-type C4-dicarboxylate transport system permease small subunit
MNRLDRALTLVENTLAAGFLAVAAALAIVSVGLRYVFGVFLFWSEEVIVYSVIYSTFLGAVITLRHNEHVRVDLLATVLGRLGKRLLAVVGGAVTIVYLVGVGVFAWLLLLEPFSSDTVTPALHLPLWMVELAVPVGLTLMLVRAVEMVYRAARGRIALAEGSPEVAEGSAGGE